MNSIALIPARLQSTRLPQKLLKPLMGKSIILRTYEAVCQSGLFSQVIVVCDHPSLYDEIVSNGGQAKMSLREHESGTDRIAEAALDVDADIIVNVQGDEPFIEKAALQEVIRLFENPLVEVASLMTPILDAEKYLNPNCVKVVVDKQGRALYFSRSPIPYVRDKDTPFSAYQHIGLYAYRKDTLMRITELPVSSLEYLEKLENLRMLENGISIYLAEVDHVGISIDTPDDYERALQFMQHRQLGD
jgi:3-deoxy-D-manno-octulosonate cytidylyltransferase